MHEIHHKTISKDLGLTFTLKLSESRDFNSVVTLPGSELTAKILPRTFKVV